jgi:hypothetical protein
MYAASLVVLGQLLFMHVKTKPKPTNAVQKEEEKEQKGE